MSHLIGVLILKKTEKFHKLFAAAQTPPRPIASNLGVAPVGSLWHVNPGALLSQPIADETSPQHNFFLSFLPENKMKNLFKLIIFLSKQKKKKKKSDWRLDYKMNC